MAERWSPLLCSVSESDLVELDPDDESQDRGDTARIVLGGLSLLQHRLAVNLVQRIVEDECGMRLIQRLHPSGLAFLETEGGESPSRRGFVVTSESSMEPRPIWPLLVPTALAQVARVDWIAACSVPKLPNLLDVASTSPDAYVLGWLPIGVIAELPTAHLVPHIGHDFPADYRQTKNHRLRAIASLPPSLA